jgi:hypothetical protein
VVVEDAFAEYFNVINDVYGTVTLECTNPEFYGMVGVTLADKQGNEDKLYLNIVPYPIFG